MTQDKLALEINPQLGVAALAAELAQRRRVQIANFLTDASAQRLMAALCGAQDWLYTYYDKGRLQMRDASEVEAASPQARAQMWRTAVEGARNGFQYLYKWFPVALYADQKQKGGHPLMELSEFVDSQAFLDFMRALTANADITYADVSVSNYGPNNFLLEHDDSNAQRNRDAAWVLNMTPDWRPDWGGYLQFYNETGDIEEGFMPKFNTLNVLHTPQPHGVSMVTPYAQGRRYAIVGWVWTGARPKPDQMIY